MPVWTRVFFAVSLGVSVSCSIWAGITQNPLDKFIAVIAFGVCFVSFMLGVFFIDD